MAEVVMAARWEAHTAYVERRLCEPGEPECSSHGEPMAPDDLYVSGGGADGSEDELDGELNVSEAQDWETQSPAAELGANQAEAVDGSELMSDEAEAEDGYVLGSDETVNTGGGL